MRARTAAATSSRAAAHAEKTGDCAALALRLVQTPGPAAIRGKTYPLRTVIAALSTYSLGYSLEATAARMKSKSSRATAASTIESWLQQYKPLMSYLRLRDHGRHLTRHHDRGSHLLHHARSDGRGLKRRWLPLSVAQRRIYDGRRSGWWSGVVSMRTPTKAIVMVISGLAS